MRTRCVTVVVLTRLLTAGCFGGPESPAPATTTGPTATGVEYPDAPETTTNGSVLAFTEAYERAVAIETARRSTSGGVRALAISITNATVTNRTANGTVVHLESDVGLRVESDSGMVSPADTQYTATDDVSDDGAVFRARTKGPHRPGPDPSTNGTTVTTI